MAEAEEEIGGKGKVVNEPELQHMLSKYSKMFKDILPKGLPPQRSIEHAIELERG